MILRGLRCGCLVAIGVVLGAWLTGYLWMRHVRAMTIGVAPLQRTVLVFRDERPHEWLLWRLYRPCLWLDGKWTGLEVVHLGEMPGPP